MSNIEEQGVGWLRQIVADSEILFPKFDTNDKTPSWDGNIFVYNEKMVKKDLLGRIPVQIKCKKVKNLRGNTISHPFEIVDLRNYFKDRGVILFVIEIFNLSEKQVYFASLLPSDLKEIIDNCKKSDGKKNIAMERLDWSHPRQLEIICKNFLIHRELQFSTIKSSPIQVVEAQELMLTGFTDGTPVEELLLNQSHYLYGKRHKDGINFFIDKININEIVKQINNDIKIDSKIFFTKYQVISNKDEKIIKFGKGISWNLNTQKITYSFSGTLAEQLTDIEFLQDLKDTTKIQIGNHNLNFSLEGKDFILQIEDRYRLLKDVEALLHIFRIDPNNLDMDKIDDNSNVTLSVLVNMMVYDRKVTQIPFSVGIKRVRIGNIVLGIVIFQREDQTYSIENLFGQINNNRFFIGDGEPKVLISPYVVLNCKFLLNIDNIDLNLIIESIKTIEYSQLYAEYVNFFLLEIIHAFDKSLKGEFLQTASEINSWLLEMECDNPINIINKYQIVRRQRELTSQEKENLIAMTSGVDNRLFCGISIVLENKSDFLLGFTKLAPKERREFIKFPIYSLARKLKLVE